MECYAEHYFEMQEMLTNDLRLIHCLEVLNIWVQAKQDKETQKGEEINVPQPKSTIWDY